MISHSKRYFRDSTHKYENKGLHAWRLNEDGSVDYRDFLDASWAPSQVFSNYEQIIDAILVDDVEEMLGDPFKESNCPSNDN